MAWSHANIQPKTAAESFCSRNCNLGPTKREKGQDFIATLCINTARYPTLRYKNWINTMRRLELARTLLFAIAGAFAELEKTRIIAKLKGARERKRAESNRRTLDGRPKCEGRKSVAEKRPEVSEAARILNDGRSLRKIAAALAEQGFVTHRARHIPQRRSSGCSAKADRKALRSRTMTQRAAAFFGRNSARGRASRAYCGRRECRLS
jgi:hypothetical protein